MWESLIGKLIIPAVKDILLPELALVMKAEAARLKNKYAKPAPNSSAVVKTFAQERDEAVAETLNNLASGIAKL